MVAAILIALWMDFTEPLWAGLTVAMVSLDTAGQPLNKSAMRMFGTRVAEYRSSLVVLQLSPRHSSGAGELRVRRLR